MRSKSKIMTIIICILLITIISFITQIAFADSQLSIVDIETSEYDKWHTSILYSDNRLLIWNEDGEEEIIPNVKKRNHTINYDFKPDYLTTNNELFYDANSASGNMKKIDNVVDFKTHDMGNKFTAYKDTNNSLYYLEYPSYGEQEIDLDEYKTYNFMDLLKLYNISHNITDYQENNNQVTLYLIFNSTCGVSKAFIQYLSELNPEVYNKFKIVGFEVNDYYNNDVFFKMTEIYDISVGPTPTTIIGDTVYEGYSELKLQEMITKINTMYEETVDTRKDFIKECNSSSVIEPVKLSDNVNQFEIYGSTSRTYLIYTTNDKKAYIYGDNPFGNEINDGVAFSTPFLLTENVKDIGEKYLLTEDNNLYVIDISYRAEFTPTATDVKSIEKVEIEDYSVILYAKTTNDTNKYIYADYYNESFESYYGPTITSIKYYRYPYEDTKYLLSNEGKLYIENTNEQISLTEIKTNIKEISKLADSYDEGIYYLNKSGELYYTCYETNGCEGDEFVSSLTNNYEFKKSEHILVLKDVETIKYLDKNFILMNDGSVYRIGENYYNEFKGDYDNYYSYVPVQISELINNGKEITPKDIVMTIDKDDVVVDEYIYYDTKMIPVNANKKIMTYIDDTNIVTKYNNKLKAINEGETQICAQVENDQDLSVCKNIKVYPKINSISISEETVTIRKSEYIILNLDYLPTNTLSSSLNLEYKVNGEYTTDVLGVQFDYVYNNGIIELAPTEIGVYGYNGGTYELEFHQIGCELESCYDTVTVNVEEYVNRIQVEIDEDYYDGINNAYMFMNEKETLQVNYKIENETATNKKVNYESSNPSVATVDNNGLITAHTPGKTTITLTSEDGAAQNSFILTVYDYSKVGAMKGDVNKDGEVNILDVIKLRKYLAGLEDLES